MKKILKNKKGFTLVELLAVIVVLGVIMAIAAGSVTKAITNSKVSSWKSNCKMLKKEGARISAEHLMNPGDTNFPSADCDSKTTCATNFGVDATDYEELKVDCSGGTCSLSASPAANSKYGNKDTDGTTALTCSGSWAE